MKAYFLERMKDDIVCRMKAAWKRCPSTEIQEMWLELYSQVCDVSDELEKGE